MADKPWLLASRVFAASIFLLIGVVAPLLALQHFATGITGPNEDCPTTKSIERLRAPVAASPSPDTSPSPTASPTSHPGARPPRNQGRTGGSGKANVALQEEQITSIAFGRELTTKRVDIWFQSDKRLPNPDRLIRLDIGIFRRSDDARIEPNTIHAEAEAFGRSVRLQVCVDRTDPAVADGGTYAGTITLFDYRVEQASVPITITMSYPFWPWPALGFYLVVLAGIPYVWALSRNDEEDNGHEEFISRASLKEMATWLGTRRGTLSVAAGIIGALTAFVANYINSPDWGAGVSQLLGLIGTMFTGFVTASTALHVAAGPRGSGRRGGGDDEKAAEPGAGGI